MSDASSLVTADRSGQLDALEQTHFDLLIIGGGITGAGIAREAALRGLTVALVEARDFASGTSSRSSKLIHGGLRYLAMGDVKLVRETALERKRLHQLAPHLAEPKWMLAPARSRAGMMKFRAAITAYEKLGAIGDEDRHQNWQGDELSQNEPSLDRATYPFACAFREYLTDDVRLVLANLRAAKCNGAVALNYLAVTEIVHDADRAVGAVTQCALTGRSLPIRARVVVNAAGPWVENVMSLDDGSAPSRLHLSRGIHIVMDRSRLPVRNLVIMSTSDRRSIFAITRGDSVYVGTTDTSYPKQATEWPEIELEDVEYLLAPVSKTFKTDPLGPQDVIAAWSGIRPLIAKRGKQAKEISRRDEIWVSDSRLITIAGGKLTGYRKMAVEVIERVLDVASDLTAKPAPANSAGAEEEPLPGGDFAGGLQNLATTLARETGVDEERAERLVRLYGTEAKKVVSLGCEPVVEGGSVVLGEIAWAVEHEAATGLEDVIYRRTRAALYCGRECDALLAPTARELQVRLGWSDAECRAQIDSVRRQRNADLAFQSDG